MPTGEWNRVEITQTVQRVVVAWCNGPENVSLSTKIKDAHGITPDRIHPTWLPLMLLVALEANFRVAIPLEINCTLKDVIEYVVRQPYPDEDTEDMLEWSTEVEILDV